MSAALQAVDEKARDTFDHKGTLARVVAILKEFGLPPEGEVDQFEWLRERLAALPSGGEVKPVAWLCYGGADGRSGKQFVTRGEADGHVVRPDIDIPLYNASTVTAPPEGWE